jgi:predicted PurR-regulated permease PerM
MPMPKFLRFTDRTMSWAALTLAVVLGAILCAFVALPFLAALVWAVTLAVLFAPLDAAIGRRLKSRSLSALITVALTAGIVVVPAILAAGTLLNEAVRSAGLVGQILNAEAWSGLLSDHPWLAPALQWIRDTFKLPELVGTLTSTLAAWSGSIVRESVSGVANLLLTFFFLFYLLRDRETMTKAVRLNLPLSSSEFSRVAGRATDTIFAIVFGTAIVAVLQGGLGGLMFWWLGLTAPVFWGVLMALLAVVPFLGAFVIWAPAAVYLALSGSYISAAVLAIWGIIVVGLVDNIVYPILVGNKLRMHTMLAFIAVVGGLIFLGVPGVVLGPLIVAVTATLLEIWLDRSAERTEASR